LKSRSGNLLTNATISACLIAASLSYGILPQAMAKGPKFWPTRNIADCRT
jgi:hypothetical protein